MAIPCLPVPIPSIPTVPAPFSVTAPALPTVNLGVNVCCQPIGIAAPSVPFELPPLVFNPAIVAVLRQAAAAAQQYIRNLPIDCPRN